MQKQLLELGTLTCFKEREITEDPPDLMSDKLVRNQEKQFISVLAQAQSPEFPAPVQRHLGPLVSQGFIVGRALLHCPFPVPKV